MMMVKKYKMLYESSIRIKYYTKFDIYDDLKVVELCMKMCIILLYIKVCFLQLLCFHMNLSSSYLDALTLFDPRTLERSPV